MGFIKHKRQLHLFLPLALLCMVSIFSIPAFVLSAMAWCLLSVAAVALAYTLNWAMLFRKKDNGSIPHSIRWIFGPYLLGVLVYNRYTLLRHPVPKMQKIAEKLYVGGRLTESDIEDLNSEKIDSVVDLTAEFDGLGAFADDESTIDYLNIPVLDHRSPKRSQLIHACRWIDERRKVGKSVLIHCALGRGRSVLTLAAYLVVSGDVASLDAALKKIKAVRVKARLNSRQRKMLDQWLEENSGILVDKTPAYIIANPASGGGKWAEARREIESYLTPYFDLTILETNKDIGAKTLAEQAFSSGAEIIIACGGDGTLNEVADVIAGTDVRLGIIPIGTANALCHVLLGWQSKIVPIHVACEALLSDNSIRRIDTAICNGERMLLVLGIGMSEHMINAADREQKNRYGQWAYLSGFYSALNDVQSTKLLVRFDGDEEIEINTKSFVIANAAPSTTVLAQGKGSPDFEDGFLDVTWLAPGEGISSDMAAVGALAMANFSSLLDDPMIKHRRVKSVKVRAEASLHYVIDGESRQAQEISVNLEPASLAIMAPSPAHDDTLQRYDSRGHDKNLEMKQPPSPPASRS